MEAILNIISKNWAQITVVLGVFGWSIQTIANYFLRKNEIRYSTALEYKIQTLKVFNKCYEKLHLDLSHFLYRTLFGQHDLEEFNKLRSEIGKDLVAFNTASLDLKLFSDNEEVVIIEDLFGIFEGIRVTIEKWHINKSNTDELMNVYQQILPEQLPNLIKGLELSFKKKYPH